MKVEKEGHPMHVDPFKSGKHERPDYQLEIQHFEEKAAKDGL